MVRVRPIEREDVTAAATLVQGGSSRPADEHPERAAEYWRAVEATRVTGGDVLVAEEDGDVIGVTQVMILAHFQHGGGRCAELESVHVRADRCNRGVGAQLLAAADELARERGCYRVQLTSAQWRHDAHRFYLAHGYEASHVGFKRYLVE
jgi:GNAT superfamily N-acetyltransferase